MCNMMAHKFQEEKKKTEENYNTILTAFQIFNNDKTCTHVDDDSAENDNDNDAADIQCFDMQLSFILVLHSGNLFKLFHCTLNNVDDIFGFDFFRIACVSLCSLCSKSKKKESVKKCITTIFELFHFFQISV